MKKSGEISSLVIERALDILLMKHPVRTAIGVMLGLTLSLLASLFSPALAKVGMVGVANVRDWQWIPLGIVLAHARTLIDYVFTRPVGNESVDEAIRLIDASNLSKEEKRTQYRALINAVLKNVALSRKTEQELAMLDLISRKPGAPD